MASHVCFMAPAFVCAELVGEWRQSHPGFVADADDPDNFFVLGQLFHAMGLDFLKEPQGSNSR